MAYTDDLGDLVDRHTQLTADLAQQLRELGDTRAALTRQQESVWRSGFSTTITERREMVRHACAHLISETETQLAEVDALRAEVANVDIRIRVAMGR